MGGVGGNGKCTINNKLDMWDSKTSEIVFQNKILNYCYFLYKLEKEADDCTDHEIGD